MKATKEEQLCIEYANEVRVQNAPENCYKWFVGPYSSHSKKAYATKVMKLDPPFIEEDVAMYYARNNQVFGDKTFSHLWDTKGLRNYGIGYLNNVSVSENEIIACQQFWFCLLYDKNAEEFDALLKRVRNEIHETIKSFHDEHPGGHFSPLDRYQLIPKKIDLLYGAYMKEGELEKSVEEPSFEVLKTPLVPKKSKEQYYKEYPDLEDFDLPF
jgi:hypothetical protein